MHPTPIWILGFGLAWAYMGVVPVAITACVFIRAAAPPPRRYFLIVHSTPSSYSLSASSSAMVPETFGEAGIQVDVPFRAEHCTVSYSLYLGQL